MNKKGGTPLTILFFVIATMALMSFTILTLLTKDAPAQTQIQSSQIPEIVNVRESEINSHIAQAVKNSAEKTTINQNAKSDFLINFKDEIERQNLQVLFPEMSTIYPQLIPSNVNIQNNMLTIRLKFKVEKTATIGEFDAAHIEHIYEKNFTAEILEPEE